MPLLPRLKFTVIHQFRYSTQLLPYLGRRLEYGLLSLRYASDAKLAAVVPANIDVERFF